MYIYARVEVEVVFELENLFCTMVEAGEEGTVVG